MSFSFDDLLERLAGRAFDHITEGLGTSAGIYFCPRDRVPMIRLPSGFYLCPTCETKFARSEPRRRPPGMGNVDNGSSDAFRPFDPFRRAGGGKRRAEAVPPRSGRAPGAPTGRRRAPPPPESREALPASAIAEAYRELSLTPPSTVAEVKKRRRELAVIHHPDIAGGDGKKLARINAAADLLLELL